MHDAIGAAAQGHGDDHGVFKGPLRQEIARADVAFHAGANGVGGLDALAHLGRRGGGRAGGAGQGQAHGFDGRGHGVGRVHAAAGAGAGAGVALDVFEDFVLGLRLVAAVVGGLDERVVGIGAVRFVAGRDVDGLAQELAVADCDGAAVDHEGGSIVPGHGHDAAGHVFIAAGEGDAGVVVLGAGYGFDAVGNDFAGLEGESHS